MAWDTCILDIQKAVGRPMTGQEIDDIVSAVQQRMKEEKAKGLTARQAAARVGQEMTAEKALAASIQRRDAYNNILKFADLQGRTIVGKEVQASRGVLSGYAAGSERNTGLSIDAAHHVKRGDLLAPALADLDKQGLLKPLQAGDRGLDLDVAKELRRRDDPTLEKDTKNKQAQAIAKILGNVMDASRAMLNKSGAFIGKIEGYMGRQYHDMWKIRGDGSDAAFKAWSSFMLPRLDHDAMFKGLDDQHINSYMRDTWSALATGRHDTAMGEAVGSNLGKKVSQQRSIQFKDAQSWFEYNEKFGKGGVMDAVFAGADGAARDSAMMDMFGTNPKAMWDKWQNSMMDAAQARGDFDSLRKLQGSQNFNNDLFDLVAGHGAIPGNQTLATIGATVRNTMQLVHLGSVVFSALSHIPINAELMRHNGSSFWEGLGNQMAAILPQSAARKEVAMSIHAGIDGMMGHIIQRFRTEDGVPGKMAEAVNQFHKWNGFGYFMDGQKAGVGLGISHSLAQNAGKEFAALDPKMQTTLRRYGIEQAEWDAGRASPQKAADGRSYLIPHNIADEAVATKFQTLITDQIREGMNEPSAYARLQATGRTQAGTAFGEVVRGVMQFKSFALSMMERQAGRMVRNGGIDYPGSLYLIAGMTMAGYVGLTLRGIVNNKTPALPTDAAGWAGLVRDAAVAGGGMGLYGDVLLRGGERSGADLALGLMGPSASTVADTIFGAKHIAEGATKQDRLDIAGQEGQKLFSNLTPNHPFISAANSYLLGHFFREMVSPGATRRYNTLLQQKGQQPILTPALQK